jgi:GTP cyclohydrolase I
MRNKKIEEHVRGILLELGVEKNSETYRNTPRRVAEMFSEVLVGMDRNKNSEPDVRLFDNNGYHEILTLKKIPFYSMCAHHLLPIFGEVSLAYIPGQKIIGLSKLPRIVRYFSARLQVQEEFTTEIADFLYKKLEAMGVFVVVKARHLCLEMRGVRTSNVETVSSAIRGVFENPSTKEEALRLLLL